MKKFFIIAAIMAVTANIAVTILGDDEPPTPVETLREQLNVAQMCRYRHPVYGYAVSYPSFFRKEEVSEDGRQCTRFRFDNGTNIIIETYVTDAPSDSLNVCAETLATETHTKQRSLTAAQKPTAGSTANSFILEGNVYENDTPADGYRILSKYIKSGKRLFVLSLIYPEEYGGALTRLFRIIGEWRVIGAC